MVSMYNTVREVLQEVYGQDAELVAGLLASTSAKTTMSVNVTLAMGVYWAYKDRGVIPNKEGSAEFMLRVIT